MTYASVCSGIEAATVAWEPLGWRPAFFAEIEPFCRELLRQRYHEVPNYGDFTKISERTWKGAIDLLVGGTPCQSFSVAGKRAGLDDDRGNLALEFLGLLDRLRPRWVVWENVPGILSSVSHDPTDPCPPPPPVDLERDGTEVETEDEYDSEELHALNCFLAGLSELGYGWAFRVLDAQFFGVPQRRRRIFVVGYLGDWRPPAAVLFERSSLSGDPAPGGEARESIAGTLGGSSQSGGFRTTDLDNSGAFITGAMSSKWAKQSGGPAGDEAYNLVTHSLRADVFDASEDGTGRGTPLCIQAVNMREKKQNGIGISEEGPMYSLTERDRHAVAFDYKQSGEIDPVMRATDHDRSHANGGGNMAVLAFKENVRGEVTGRTHSRQVMAQMAVRRLTPMECERLQGLPDNWTAITYRGKPAKDGPRYRALGNSMAVPVMRWIGERIALVEALLRCR